MVVRWWMLVCLVAACGDNLHWTATPCTVSGDYSDIRLQGLSSDSSYVAFIGDNSLYVTSARCDGPTQKVADDIAHAWFCGSALLAFPNPYTDDTSPALIAWNPAFAATAVASRVDPTATHCSPDERYFTTEANDVLNDGSPVVKLMLFDTNTLRPVEAFTFDRPRARFTHDSMSLLVAGGDIGGVYSLWRFSIATGTSTRIAPIEHSRFEISKDDQYVVFVRLGLLVRLSLADGTEEVLANDVMSVPGRDQLIADDDLVAYIGRGGLQVVPVAGGPPKTLAPASSLVAHMPGVIFYFGPQGFSAVTTSGDMQVFKNGIIEDSSSDRVLVIGGSRRHLVDLSSFTIHLVAGNYLQAALTHDDRIVALEPDTSIHVVTGYDDVVLPATQGAPFVVDAERRTLAAVEYAPRRIGVHVVSVALP